MPPLTRGDRLGPYEILDVLGAGGMGHVYRARDARLDRTVAIKVSSEQFSTRFEQEARAIAQMNHPHICQLYDVGSDYLVMEYVEGSPVAGPLPLAQAVDLAAQILDAIGAAHARGILHRDLKPANILVTKQGIKLLDFGLAKSAPSVISPGQDATIAALTSAGEIVGTLQYMAPEQLQGKSADERSDLFSFGCVLYEMLTGTRAFDGGDPASVIAAVLTREPAAVTAVPPSLGRIVRRSLAKEPDQRFQTARDLKAALLWAAEQPPGYTNTSSPIGRRARLALTGVVATAALVVGYFAGAMRQPAVTAKPVEFEISAAANGRFVFGTNTGGIQVSPDGTRVAYVASVEGVNSLWVRRLDKVEATAIPGTESAGHPFWSPDGESIGFSSGTTLKRISVSGGAAIVLCPVNALRGAAWLPSGDIIFGSVGAALQRVSASGGVPVRLTELDASRNEGFHGFPQLLDDDRFLYFARTDIPENTGVFLSSLSRPSERRFLLQTEGNALVAGWQGSHYLLWTRGGTLLAQPFDLASARLTGEAKPVADNIGTTGITGAINATVSNDGVLIFSSSNAVSVLTWIDRSGKVLGTVGPPGDYNTFDLSADGTKVVASLDRAGGSDLWLLDTARQGLNTRLTFRNASSSYPIWSPSGAELAFGSDPLLNIFKRSVDGAHEDQRLTRATLTQLPLDWSRDGTTILIYQVGGALTGRDLLTLPGSASGLQEPKPYVRSPSNEWWAKFIPTVPARWVAYQSDESGRWEIYIDSYPTSGRKRRISTGGGQFPHWGPGGRELFYAAPDYTLMAVKITATDDVVESSMPQPLFRLPAVDTGRAPYDVAPDGERFLVRAVPPGAARTLMATINWPAKLQ